MRYDIVAVGAFLLVICVLMFQHRRKRAAVKAERLAMFDECLPLLEDYKIIQDDIYYPKVKGYYHGYAVTLEPIADHVGFRMLPSLWLLVTLHREIPYKGIFDFLVRPRNLEFYSPSSTLEVDIAVPDGWPKPAAFRTDNPDDMPPKALLEPYMGIFDDYRAKELLITANGIRLVYQAKVAEMSYYRLLRQVVFEDITIQRDIVESLLDIAVSIYQDLIGENHQVGEEKSPENDQDKIRS